jgi:hypothetical protein
MSYIFEYGDRVVWSPALRVGETYVGLVGTLSAVLSVPDGLSPMASDFYLIDGDRFGEFVAALADFHNGHPIARSLLDGLYLTSLVLLDRVAGGSVERLEPALLPAVEELSRSMPGLP